MGLPLESLSASGSDDLTTRHEATGNSEAWPSGSSKINLRTCFSLSEQLVCLNKNHFDVL